MQLYLFRMFDLPLSLCTLKWRMQLLCSLWKWKNRIN